MKYIKITESQRKRAKSFFKFGALAGSITKGKGNFLGALGEIISADYYKAKGFKVNLNSTYAYDFILDGLKVDVKTRSLKRPPQSHNEVRLPHYNTHQKTDYYLFVVIDKKFEIAWLLGYIKKDNYFKKARFYKKGTSRSDGWKYRVDTYVITVEQLKDIK